MQAPMIRAKITAYSTAVGPDSSFINRVILFVSLDMVVKLVGRSSAIDLAAQTVQTSRWLLKPTLRFLQSLDKSSKNHI